MKSSLLLEKPVFVPHFDTPNRPEYEAAVAKRVREYFCLHWPWVSESQKEKYAQEDTELFALLLCPRAPEGRAEVGGEFIVFFFAFDDVPDNLGHDTVIIIVPRLPFSRLTNVHFCLRL
jgi:hypothetical protein